MSRSAEQRLTATRLLLLLALRAAAEGRRGQALSHLKQALQQ